MSTDANAALAWPIEITEDAAIGIQLVSRKKTPAAIRELWTRPDEAPPPDLVLMGTSIPGAIHFKYPDEVDARTGIQFDYPEAGVWWEPDLQAYCVRPFTGDPLSDPRVREEGTETGYMLYDPWFGSLQDWEAQLLRDAPSLTEYEQAQFDEFARQAEDDEPTDYDGYVDYVCGRTEEGQ